MTDGRPEPEHAAAEAIPDFPDLYPRQVAFNTYVVLSLSDGEPTAYQVDVSEGSCTCPDHTYNREDGEVCKHVAAAMYYAPRKRSVEEWTAKNLSGEVRAVQRAAQRVEQAATSVESQATPEATAGDGADESASTSLSDEDLMEAFYARLEDAGLDAGDFRVWVHNDYGSLNVDRDGYLDDDEFDAWVSLTDDLGMAYDGNDEVNYLKREDAEEVLG